MGKPTKRVTKTIKIQFHMTEVRAERFEKLLSIFLQAIRYQPYPDEYLNEEKGDYLDMKTEARNGQ